MHADLSGANMSPEVCVNARFRHQRITGVQRYADAILARLPSGVRSIAPARSMAHGMRGHLWEQFTLPWRVGRGVLWSPCNTGPLIARRHVVTVHDLAFIDC